MRLVLEAIGKFRFVTSVIVVTVATLATFANSALATLAASTFTGSSIPGAYSLAQRERVRRGIPVRSEVSTAFHLQS